MVVGLGSKHGRRSIMKFEIDLKGGFLQSLKREVLATLTPEERAVIEVSTGEMGNKPDAVNSDGSKCGPRRPGPSSAIPRRSTA